MKRIIPGHARAYTIWLFLVLGIFSYVYTKSPSAVFGLLVLIFGMFLGDQATHLAQNDHSVPPPTWLEKCLQNHRYVSVFIGTILALLGSWMILNS